MSGSSMLRAESERAHLRRVGRLAADLGSRWAHILFGSYRDGPLDLYQGRPVAYGRVGRHCLEVQKDPTDWSRDGGTVLVTENTAEGRGDVVAVTPARDENPVAASEAVGGAWAVLAGRPMGDLHVG